MRPAKDTVVFSLWRGDERIMGRYGEKASPAIQLAERLQVLLAEYGISTDLHAGDRIALVSLWTDLVVWTDGTCVRWWNGKVSPRTRRLLFTNYNADDLPAAARTLTRRYQVLRSKDHFYGLEAAHVDGSTVEPQ
ncbi:hypothetical protein [Spongiactinospora sp. TRM90649]|uniref:hypothetical protein n=1 Tax=Spongiactinospora sp. TRM90649 TaxID=3031114 RepID=UPI0023F6F44E|nr:hypothetical protein [Spongiactinospora sp. TRM90649]MDF5756185.1 hypothetical protein [Spongiactinospora sp. TRM90649]